MRSLIGAAVMLAMAAPPLEVKDPDVKLGIQQVQEGDFERAVVTLDSAVRRLRRSAAPDRSDLISAYLNLGVAYVGLDQIDDAKAEFREAVRLNPALRLDPDEFSPRVLGTFEAARREERVATALDERRRQEPSPPPSPAPRPSPASGPSTARPEDKGGSKVPFVLLGVGGAAAAVGVAVAAGGDEPAPSPSPVLTTCAVSEVSLANARFEPQTFACPDGVSNFAYDLAIIFDATTRGCTTTFTSGTVLLTVVAVQSSSNFVGQTFTQPLLVPSQEIRNTTAGSLRASVQNFVCGNSRGGPVGFAEFSGRMTIVTPSGPITVPLINNHRITAP